MISCFENKFETELLYTASVDGFSFANFHNKCDNKGPNISIIKSEHGLIFGGYTSLSWDNSNQYAADNKNPFIFSLSKKTKHLNHA